MNKYFWFSGEVILIFFMLLVKGGGGMLNELMSNTKMKPHFYIKQGKTSRVEDQGGGEFGSTSKMKLVHLFLIMKLPNVNCKQ